MLASLLHMAVLTVTHGSPHCYTWWPHCYTRQSSLLHMVASLLHMVALLLHTVVLTVTHGDDTGFTSIDAAPLKYHDTLIYCDTAHMLEC